MYMYVRVHVYINMCTVHVLHKITIHKYYAKLYITLR